MCVVFVSVYVYMCECMNFDRKVFKPLKRPYEDVDNWHVPTDGMKDFFRGTIRGEAIFGQ